MFQTTTKATARTLLLCTVGAVALTIQLPQGAHAQSNLPAVTVDAPRAERARTARPVASTRAGTTRRDHAFVNEQRAAVHDREAAELAWSRSMQFFGKHLS